MTGQRRASARPLTLVALLALCASACVSGGGSAQSEPTVPQEPSWLFTMRAEEAEASFEGGSPSGTIELRGLDPTVVAFTDRPHRQADTESTATFESRWDERFAGDPPEAALLAHSPRGTLVIEVDGFDVTGEGATLEVQVVQAVSGQALGALDDVTPLDPDDLSGTLQGVTLFIDSATGGPEPRGGAAEGEATSTPHLDAVVAQLQETNPTSEGIAWFRSSGNLLGQPGEPDDSWLLQTPECWGQSTCSTDSFKRMERALELVASSARSILDITTLYPYPDGDFRQALVDGLGRTFAEGHRPLVRVIGGVSPGGSIGGSSPDGWRDALVSDVAAASGVDASEIPVAVASVATSWGWSWNHAKVVAADGKVAVIGGHNLWTADYLQTTNPINDVSVLHRGPLVAQAHGFVDTEWGFICANTRSPMNVDYQATGAVGACPSTAPELEVGGTPGAVEALSIGRLGMGIQIPQVEQGPLPNDLVSRADASAAACSWLTNDYTNRDAPYERANPGEPALRALIASANTSVTITQQDLIGLCSAKIVPKWDVRVFDALAERIAAGVEVRIVISSPGTKDYSNGGSLADVSSYLLSRVQKAVGDPEQARDRFCAQVGIAPLRFNGTDDTWPGGQGIGNHTKVVAVDRAAFYVGSQNLYPAWLQEYGVIVEDHTAAGTFYSKLLDPMWEHSERAKDTSQCP